MSQRIRRIRIKGLELLHIKDLKKSGLTASTITTAKMKSVNRSKAKEILGFDPKSDGLLFPYIIKGEEVLKRIKPDNPYSRPNEKPAKYLSPKGARNHLYFPPILPDDVWKDNAKPLIITEGEKKALKAVQEGFVCIGLSGVWCWRAKIRNESISLPELDDIEWSGRRVFIAFDSDVAINEKVKAAEDELAKELMGRGADVRILRLPSAGGKVGLDDYLVQYGPEGFRALMEEALKPVLKKKKDEFELMLELILPKIELFRDQHATPWVRVRINSRKEVMRVNSKSFKTYVDKIFYDALGSPPNNTDKFINICRAQALFDGEEYLLNNRVANLDDHIYYDLADDLGRAVIVGEPGWSILEDPTILFSRYSHQKEQVEPIRGGDIMRLFEFINVPTEDRVLLLIALIAAFVPDIPHPVLVLHGPQGSGKSSVFRFLRQIIDPSSLATLSLISNQKELVQIMDHHWTLFFDNVRPLSDGQSDAICRAITGEGVSKRELYTDDDDIIRSYKRVVGLNGINIAATQPDLLDRSILIGLKPFPERARKTEEELKTHFLQHLPEMLGAIFDTLVEAKKNLPKVKIADLPRMADFAKWGVAISKVISPDTDFIATYRENMRQQHRLVIESMPIADAIVTLMSERKNWRGSPSELLEILVNIAEERRLDTTSADWPKAANALTRRIKQVQMNLSAIGIEIGWGRNAHQSLISLRKKIK